MRVSDDSGRVSLTEAAPKVVTAPVLRPGSSRRERGRAAAPLLLVSSGHGRDETAASRPGPPPRGAHSVGDPVAARGARPPGQAPGRPRAGARQPGGPPRLAVALCHLG